MSPSTMLAQELQSIDIAGFKSIEKQRIEFRPLNVLIGANGSGKSNLLSLFAFLRAFGHDRLTYYVKQQGGANRFLHFGAKTTQQIELEVRCQCRSGTEQYTGRFEYRVSDELLIAHEAVTGKQFEMSGHKTKFTFSGPVQLFKELRVHHFHDTSERAEIRQHCEKNNNYGLNETGGNLAAVLYKIEHTDPTSFEIICDTIRQAAPFFQSFELNPDSTSRENLSLRWRDLGSDESFDCHQLSDGTLRFIALVTLLMQPPDDLPAIVILDEPELGLHPHAITLLASMIQHAANYRQIIVATQSVELLDHFEPEDIIVADRQGPATEFRRLDVQKLNKWLEEYTLGELWNKNIFGGRPFAWHGST